MRYVVLGATGGIGHAVALVAATQGHTVRAVARDASHLTGLPSTVERFSADALDPGQVLSACKDAEVIVHGVNVPYPRWPELVPRIAANIRQAAESCRATLAFPGNVYPYGRPRQHPVLENHPVAPCSVKGRIRAQIEQEYLEAHTAGRLRLVLPRFPDFYGPYSVNALYAPIFDGAISGKGCRWPLDPDKPHEFIFIEDAAKAMVQLVETPPTHGLVVHVPGPGATTGRRFIELAYQAAGRPPKFSVFGRGLWRFAGLFDAEVRGAYELSYLFDDPVILGDGRFSSLVGSPPPATPYAEGVRTTLEWFRGPERAAVRTTRNH